MKSITFVVIVVMKVILCLIRLAVFGWSFFYGFVSCYLGLYIRFGGLQEEKKVCLKCKSPNMVPIDTPMGRKLHKEFYQNE
jgi:hypothetical protein